MRILGLDPGLQRTGWGIIEQQGNRVTHIAHGVVISKAKDTLADRLTSLHRGIEQIIQDHKPDCAAVEETFVNANPRSALALGQARGIALVVPALHGLLVAEYAANLIKKSVTGQGHADKTQIAAMIKILLNVTATADAADALAVAICHAHHGLVQMKNMQMIQK